MVCEKVADGETRDDRRQTTEHTHTTTHMFEYTCREKEGRQLMSSQVAPDPQEVRLAH